MSTPLFEVRLNKPAIQIALERAGYIYSDERKMFVRDDGTPFDVSLLEQAAREIPEQVSAVVASRLMTSKGFDVTMTMLHDAMRVEFVMRK
jgi:hypothetical protein